LVKAINGGSGNSFPIALGSIGNVGYFYVRFDLATAQLYRSDGTAAGTTLVKDVSPGAKFFTVVGNVAYFDAGDASGGGELWKTDGTSGGTSRVQDLWPGPTSSAPAGGGLLPAGLRFPADQPQYRRALWKLPV